MVGLAPQVLLPKALLPEAEALHVLVVVTEGSETKRRTLKKKKNKLKKKRTTGWKHACIRVQHQQCLIHCVPVIPAALRF